MASEMAASFAGQDLIFLDPASKDIVILMMSATSSAGGSSDQWPALGQSFGPLSPASWGQVSSAAAQRAVQIQQAASAEQMSQMVAEMRTIAHNAATAATRAVVQELRQPSLSPKPDPGDTAHHAATSAPAPALVPAPMPPPLSPGSLGDDLGALPVAPPRQLGAHDLGRSLKTTLSQFSTTDSWPIYRDDFLAHLTTVNPVLVAVLLGARPPAHGLTAESFSLLQQQLSATLTVVMKSHPTAATRLRNLRRSDTFAAADNPGTLAWDQLCTHLDRRGVARTVRHLLALQQPQSPSEDQGAFTQRMLNAYHELNDSPVSLHSNVLHENVLVAATLAGMHNTVARDTILSALDAAETRAEDISYGRLCDMMHRHPTTPDSKPTRPGQDVAAFAAAVHTQLHSQVEAAVVAAMARAPPPARPSYARPPRGGPQNNARQHPPTTPCRICESTGQGKRFHWHAHCPLNQAPAAPTAAPPPAPATHQAVVSPVSAASAFSDELSHMMAFLGNPDSAAPNAMMAHAGPSGIHAGFLSVFCGKAAAPLPVAASGMFLVDGGANICMEPDVSRFRAYSPLTTPVPCSGLGVDILGFGSIDISVVYSDGVSRALTVRAAHAPGMTARGAPTILSQEYLRREHGVSFSYPARGAPSATDSHGSLVLTMVNDLPFLTGGHAESPGGAKFLLGVIDHYSNYIWLAALSSKRDIITQLRLVLLQIRTICSKAGQRRFAPSIKFDCDPNYLDTACRSMDAARFASPFAAAAATATPVFSRPTKRPAPPASPASDWHELDASPVPPAVAPGQYPPASRIPVPDTIKQALAGKYHKEWRASIVSELRSLRARNTFAYARLPVGRHAIGNKWVFKVKANSDGSVNRFKARLVAQGFSQQAGVDYHATFSPVVKLSTLRTCLAVAAARGMHIHQIDIETAFLNASLKEEIYMRQPKGAEDGTDNVLRLLKSIYGLKQASREWYELIHKTLTGLGLARSNSDTSMYSMNHPRYGICIVLVYVDDILVVSDSVEWIRSAKSAIGAEFNMTDFGEAAFVLGMDLTRCWASGTIRLSQEQYTLELLEKYGMQDCSPAKTPMGSGHYKDLASASDADKAPLSREDHETYRAILGSVNFLTMCTRPDLAFAISVLSRFQSAPQKIHLMQLKRVLRYLKGTPGMGITYGATEPGGARLVVYSDSDWAADTSNRRSQSGDISMLNGGAIGWNSKQQETTALSTTEAEYVALSRAAQNTVHFRQLLQDIHQQQQGPTIVYEDNQGAVKLANNPMASHRTKHIDIKHHYTRDLVDAGTISVTPIATTKMLADGLTKALPEPTHTLLFRQCMGTKSTV
eukprot:jgi/Tetstr1/439024/TSEL_027516.t1